MRHLQIRPDLYLLEQEVVKSKDSKPKKESINHIWIYDRSGSMSYSLPGLAKDLIGKAKEIPVGDSITLGWFSGEGQFNFILKGFKVTEVRDYKILEDTINRNKSSVGCTCFSEILSDTETVLKDLAPMGNKFALCFFTDGYPVVSSYTREIEAIQAAIKKIQGKISSALLVGYGNYYNKELMSTMAERLGGTLIHSSDLTSFTTSLGAFIEDARENDNKIQVTLMAPSDLVFGINGKQVNLYSAENGVVSFVPTTAAKDYLYSLIKQVPKGSREASLESDAFLAAGKAKAEPLVRGCYAAAYVLTQRTKTDMALDVLGCLGDKALIDLVNNSFTNAEYGAAEAKIVNAMAHSNARFKGGRDTGYLPPADAFCLLDVVDLLMADPEAFFYPYHPEFSYNRIGVGSKTADGYPKFQAEKDVKCPLNALTWNDTKLNLSIRAKIQGTVNLIGSAGAVGLAQEYPTFVYRNYALVKDGFLNVQRLPVSVSIATWVTLRHHGLVEPGDSNVMILDLTKVPIINRVIADGKTSATELGKKAVEEARIEAQIKALNYFRNELDPIEDRKMADAATPAQADFLMKNGIGRNGFAPPTEKEESTDFYMAKEFEIKLKGLSSYPKVDEVMEKAKKGAKLTVSALLVKSGIDLYDQSLAKSSSDKVRLAWLEEKIMELQCTLRQIRSDIQRTKFAVILGKKWFDECTSREKNSLQIGDTEVMISLIEKRVAI